MSHVTGASVVEGKYVYIRGLGDRYSSVQLNGSSLPNADPDKRSVPMDLFPTALLDNIVTTKSFTPDKPGDFAGEAVDIEDLESGEDSRARLEAGDLVLAHNIWWGFGAGEDLASIAPDEFVADHLSANSNQIVDPLLSGISRSQDGGLDPRPQTGSPAWSSGGTIPDDGFYTQVDYVGAFGNELWTSG